MRCDGAAANALPVHAHSTPCQSTARALPNPTVGPVPGLGEALALEAGEAGAEDSPSPLSSLIVSGWPERAAAHGWLRARPSRRDPALPRLLWGPLPPAAALVGSATVPGAPGRGGGPGPPAAKETDREKARGLVYCLYCEGEAAPLGAAPVPLWALLGPGDCCSAVLAAVWPAAMVGGGWPAARRLALRGRPREAGGDASLL